MSRRPAKLLLLERRAPVLARLSSNIVELTKIKKNIWHASNCRPTLARLIFKSGIENFLVSRGRCPRRANSLTSSFPKHNGPRGSKPGYLDPHPTHGLPQHWSKTTSRIISAHIERSTGPTKWDLSPTTATRRLSCLISLARTRRATCPTTATATNSGIFPAFCATPPFWAASIRGCGGIPRFLQPSGIRIAIRRTIHCGGVSLSSVFRRWGKRFESFRQCGPHRTFLRTPMDFRWALRVGNLRRATLCFP